MKRAFTLIEVLISIVLLGLITIFVSSIIQQTKKTDSLFAKKVKKDENTEAIYRMLYRDIFQSKKIILSTFSTYSVLKIETKNSVYNIDNPYVIWLVLKKHHTLIRLETSKNINVPIEEKYERYVFADKLIEQVEHFSINLSKDKKYILVFIEIKNKKPILFEIKKS
jgi:prepilin-type N-terminal cleavage/methylation domain-containing protein